MQSLSAMIKLCVCVGLIFMALIGIAHAQDTVTTAGEASIDTNYDAVKDRTTVRLSAMKISGEKGKYYSLHMSPSFSYSGRTFVRTKIIDFELQTVVKGRLKTDLYVVFVIDGEEIFLSSNRSAIDQPVRGRLWKGERLVFRMPIETLNKLANAKRAMVKFDGTTFEFDDNHRQALRTFAGKGGSGR